MKQNNVDDQLRKMAELSTVFDKLWKHFQDRENYIISKPDIFNALYLRLENKMEFELAGDLWDVNIDFKEAVGLLQDFDFSMLHKTIETSKAWFPEGLLIQRKVRFKHQGQIWVIHKCDKDPFPSSPHAHDIDNGMKLDLSNGKCYKIKKHIHTITRKQLLLIREKAKQVYKGNLPSLEQS